MVSPSKVLNVAFAAGGVDWNALAARTSERLNPLSAVATLFAAEGALNDLPFGRPSTAKSASARVPLAAVYGFAPLVSTFADCMRSADTSTMSLRSQASGVAEVSIVALISQLCGSPARRT